jgi:hypothetical protein
MFSNDFTPKKPLNFYCNFCTFNTSNKKDFNRHNLTKKHIFNVCQSESIEKTPKPQQNPYECNCGKTYKDYSGLWRHKKKCIFEDKEIKENFQSNEIQELKEVHELKEIMKYLMKENSEMKNMMMEQHTSTQNMMMEVIKTGTHNTTNSHNKTFNLQFFLNETCKDAMNITDFVNSIQLQLSDLERVGEIGYVDGISNIIMKNLKQLDVTKRPVHCTDKKREVLYVKDENKWEKEDAENKIIRKAIKKVSHKNIQMIPQFKDAHPDCSKSASKYSDQYNKIMVESFGGPGDDDSKKEDKIIKNLSKTIVIEREAEPL